MKRAAILAVALTLTACGEPMILYKPDMTSRSYAKDTYECERDARQVRYGRYEDPMAFAVRCMNARGWSYVAASAITPQAKARIQAQWNDHP